MDFDGAVQIFFLSFSWQSNKEWKRTEKWFCLGLRMGALEFIIFFNGVFMLNFLGLWIWFLGYEFYLLEFICWRFRCWLKDEKIWVWVEILYIWVLWFEKIWEDLLLGLCLYSCWKLICVYVWLIRKGKKNARKSGHVFSCLNLGLFSLMFLLKMNLDLGNSYFFFC